MSQSKSDPRARYPLLANLILTALEHLRAAERRGDHLQLSGDDQHRFLILLEQLKMAWQAEPHQPSEGLALSASDHPLTRALTHPRDDTLSKKARVAQVLQSCVPATYTFNRFAPRAAEALVQVIERGLPAADSADRQFIDGPLTLFLTRLSALPQPRWRKRRSTLSLAS